MNMLESVRRAIGLAHGIPWRQVRVRIRVMHRRHPRHDWKDHLRHAVTVTNGSGRGSRWDKVECSRRFILVDMADRADFAYFVFTLETSTA